MQEGVGVGRSREPPQGEACSGDRQARQSVKAELAVDLIDRETGAHRGDDVRVIPAPQSVELLGEADLRVEVGHSKISVKSALKITLRIRTQASEVRRESKPGPHQIP